MDTDSILLTVKKLCTGSDADNSYDDELVIHTNTVLTTLNDLGVGPEGGFSIDDEGQTYSEFMGNDPRLNLVKSYLPLKVKMLFDPPTSSSLMQALEHNISELEWRILHKTDTVL